jgi:hypothetical protein
MSFDDFKKFLTSTIVQAVLKVGAGVIGTLGVSQGSATEIIGAIVSFGLGYILNVLNVKKALNTEIPFHP